MESNMTIHNSILTKYDGTERHVVIPNSVTKIGERAFFGCTSLQRVELPDSVTEIGKYAFGECKNLERIEIPDSVTTIAHKAFYRCERLKSVSIPNSVTHIGYKAFYRCEYLSKITIPASVTSLGGGSFCCCGLHGVQIQIASDNPRLQIVYSDSSPKAGILVFDDKLVSAFGELRVITIPDFVKHIGEGAFSRCKSLHKVTIPNSVISIGRNAFYRCNFLHNLIIPSSVTSISEKAFYKCEELKVCVYSEVHCSGIFQYQLQYDGTVHIVGCNDNAQISIHIPHQLDGYCVASLGDNLFSWFRNLKEVTIPNSVKYIGDYFCSDCSSLERLTIPGTVRDIGSYICHFCSSLKYVDIQNGVREIGSHAFEHCWGLVAVCFPNSIEYIGGMPFYNSPHVRLGLPRGSNFSNSTGMNVSDKYGIPYTLI